MDVADHLDRIDEDGYTVLEGAIEPELVASLRDTIRRLEVELDVRPRETAAEGHSTKRITTCSPRTRRSSPCRSTPRCCRSSRACSTAAACCRG